VEEPLSRITFVGPLRHPSIRFAPSPRRFSRGRAFLRASLLAALAATAATFGHDLIGSTPAVSSVTPAADPRPAWIELARAAGAFAVAMPGLDPAPSYLVRRHRDGGGRKDILTFGAPGEKNPYVRIEAYRPGGEGEAATDPLDAVASLAAESRIDAELAETPMALKTKFGQLPVIDMNITGKYPRACIAVAGGWDDPRFGLVVWWCNPGPELVAHGQLACLLDRLTLMGAGGDDRLATFFAKAELKRNFCGAPGAIVTATPRRTDDWISQKAVPALRGRIAAR
jgi:hypothetical protein